VPVELGLVEQRYKAVLEAVESGATVTDVGRRYGVGRQTVNTWLRRFRRATNVPLDEPRPRLPRVRTHRKMGRRWCRRNVSTRCESLLACTAAANATRARSASRQTSQTTAGPGCSWAFTAARLRAVQ
jgi:transposase-like protein